MFLRLYPTNLCVSADFQARLLAHEVHNRSLYLPISEVKIQATQSKMTLSQKSLAGPGYIILNAIRVMNIMSFVAVIAASVVMLVKTSTASKVCRVVFVALPQH